jgi:type VI secretion system secreted protein Hcp
MAQVDVFLKLDGVKGESADHKHPDEIMIESWSLGAQNAASFGHGGGGGSGKVKMEDIHITKKTDASSPNLFVGCCSGKHYAKAEIVNRKAGEKQVEFLKLTLTDVFISSFQTSENSDSGTIPTDSVSLAFSKIEIAYKTQKADGSAGPPINAGWNVKTNEKV